MTDTTKDKILTALLTPLSWIYQGGTALRNWLFDSGIIKQHSFDVPVVCVGNLTVGGTGKTPHVEYIARRLAAEYNIAILSRGYKRKTKGFVLANTHSTPDTIGDEPYQIFSKYGSSVKVAVCENRREGIKKILEEAPDTNLILLDDAFQHRYVLPKVSILLMDYNHPIYDDHVLPLGRLRESQYAMNRADMVVVTKCPDTMLPLNCRMIKNTLRLFANQKLYFSKYEYDAVTPVFPNDHPYNVNLSMFTRQDSVLLVTGIANPRGFINSFSDYPFRKRVAHYPDHHDFSRADIKALCEKFEKMKGVHKIILTTEKDAMRLMNNPYIPQRLKSYVYYVPINVRMVPMLEANDFISDLKKLINAQSR